MLLQICIDPVSLSIARKCLLAIDKPVLHVNQHITGNQGYDALHVCILELRVI